MAFHNLLSICVLIAALATGDCFFSNLMNEPLNFAVSLLDGQAQNTPVYSTTEWPMHTPGPITVTGNAGTTFTAMPGGHAKYKDIVAKKLAGYIGGSSNKSKLPKVEAVRHSSDSSSSTEITGARSSEESSNKIIWKHVRPALKRPSNKAYNQRLKASISTGSGHSGHRHTHARPALSKAGHKLRQSGWRKRSWVANRSSGSSEKYPVVTAKQARGVGSSSSSSEENIIIVKRTPKKRANILRGSSTKYPVVTVKHAKDVGSSSSSSEEDVIVVKKTARPVNKLREPSKQPGWKKSRWAANISSGSGDKYPVVTAKQARGVGSSSSSSEEDVIVVKKTARVNKLRGPSKQPGWKKSRWAANISSGSGDKYPVVTAKQARGVGSSSSSSEENTIMLKKTAGPAHSFRASKSRQSYRGHNHNHNRNHNHNHNPNHNHNHNNQAVGGGYKSQSTFSPKLRPGYCNLCKDLY